MFILLERKEAGDELDAVYYEVQMLNYSIRGQHAENQTHANLILEGALLHARNLIDFLENNKKYSDDLTCIYFKNSQGDSIPGYKLPIPTDLKEKINKHLQHLTLARKDEKPAWDLEKIRKTVNKELKEFINKIDNSYFPTKKGFTREDFNTLFFEWRKNVAVEN